MAAAVETFKLSTLGDITSFTDESQFSCTKRRIPLPSDPITMAVLPDLFILSIVVVAYPSIPITQNPLSFNVSMARLKLVTLTIGKCSIVPADAFTIAPDSRGEFLSCTIRPSVLNATQERMIAPIFCGSVTWSKIKI